MSTAFRSFTSPRKPPLASQPGCIGVVSGNRGTYWEFVRCLHTLQMPNAMLGWGAASGGTIAKARNQLVDQALANGAEWIWFIDDDHVFEPDVVPRLLAHERDIVVPLILRRLPPFDPYLFGPPCPVDPAMSDADLAAAWKQVPLPQRQDALRLRGVVEMGTCGSSGSLVAMEVFRAMPKPWYEFGAFLGDRDRLGHDVWFGLKARRAGFRIWCDTDTRIGHLTTAAVWPTRSHDGRIHTELKVGPSLQNAGTGRLEEGTGMFHSNAAMVVREMLARAEADRNAPGGDGRKGA